MNIDQMKKQILEGLHIKNDAEIYLPREDEATIAIYIDLIKYGTVYSAARWLTSDFNDSFNSLSIEERVELSLLDRQHILSAVVLSEMIEQNYEKWLTDQNFTLKEMATAIAIENEDFDAIDRTDDSILYRYFVNSQIRVTDLAGFSNPTFVPSMLDRLLIEERVIFTWILQNLILMIQNLYLNPSQYKTFFTTLFDKHDYIQGELSQLFNEATSKYPKLMEELTKCSLSIDPFTKQIDYSLWLRDSAKFLYLAKLRTLNGVEITKQIEVFDRKLKIFKEINQHDLSTL